MNEKTGHYHGVDFPPERRGMPSFNDIYRRKHCMYALLEAEATTAPRQLEKPTVTPQPIAR
jgi:hypothetical protein